MFGRKPKPIDSSATTHEGWAHLRVGLDRLADEPGEPEWWVQVGARLAAIAVMPPATIPANGRVPMGFSVRPDGTPQDAGATGRALAWMTMLIDNGMGLEFLLPLRAQLNFGWRRHELAIADLQRAMHFHSPGSEEFRDLERRLAECVRAPSDEPQPTEEDFAVMRKTAEGIGNRTANLTHFQPAPRDYFGPDASPVAIDPRLLTLGEQLVRLGFEHLGWVEDLGLSATMGARAVQSIWADGETAVVAHGIEHRFSFEAETLLSDGRILVTTRGRGRNFYLGGPWNDALHVDDSESIDDLVGLHRARLRVLLVTTPGLEVTPMRSLADSEAMQEVQRKRKADYRLIEGLGEEEARGIPFGPPDFVVPILRASARAASEAKYRIVYGVSFDAADQAEAA